MGNAFLVTADNKLSVSVDNKLRVGAAADPCCCEPKVCWYRYTCTYTCATATWTAWTHDSTTCELPDAHTATTRTPVSVTGEGDTRVGTFEYYISGAACSTAGGCAAAPDPPATETGEPPNVCWACNNCGDCCFSSESTVRFQLAALSNTSWLLYDCTAAPEVGVTIPSFPAIDVTCVRAAGAAGATHWSYTPETDPATLNIDGIRGIAVAYDCATGEWFWEVSYWIEAQNSTAMIGNGNSPSGLYDDCSLDARPTSDCCGATGSAQLWLWNLAWQDTRYRKNGSYTVTIANNHCCCTGEANPLFPELLLCSTIDQNCDGTCNPLP